MNPTAIWAMVAVCGFVWGTFVALVIRAWRREAAKEKRRRS